MYKGVNIMSINEYAEMVGKKIRFLLDQNEMTQKELADKLGVSTATVSNWCTGVKTPRMGKIDAMCKIFGINRSEFVGENETVAYYMNPETAELAQQLFEDKDLRVLFDAARDSSPEDLKMAADLLRRLKGTNPNA